MTRAWASQESVDAHDALARVRGLRPRPESVAYSATTSPEPPNSAGKSFSFGSPSRMGSTVSA